VIHQPDLADQLDIVATSLGSEAGWPIWPVIKIPNRRWMDKEAAHSAQLDVPFKSLHESGQPISGQRQLVCALTMTTGPGS
jgi:hypothetical protein